MTDVAQARVETRSAELLELARFNSQRRVDAFFTILLLVQWLFAIICAWVVSPTTWSGTETSIHMHLWMAICLGGLIVLFPWMLVWRMPGTALSRHAVAVAQMLQGALLIHLTGGRIETHFHVFGSLAFLALYRDRGVLITATAVVVIDHFGRGYFWPQSIYGTESIQPWRWIEHASWVAFEDVVLITFISAARYEREGTCRQQAELEATKDRIEGIVAARTEALKRSEAMFRRIVETAQEGIWFLDADVRTTFANERLAEMLGVGIDDMQGKSIYDFMDAEDIPAAEEKFRNLRQSMAQSHDFRLRHRDGSDIWTIMAANPVMDDEGHFIGALVLITDVTRRREDESRLRKAHEESDLLLSSISSILIGFDGAMRVRWWNDAAHSYFAMTAAEAIGKTVNELSSAWHSEDVLALMQLAQHERSNTHREVIMVRDGEERILDMTICPARRMESTHSLAFLLLATDVTTRRIEDRMRAQGSKLESVGQLAAGIAHEINTPIQFIGDNIRFLSDAFTDITAVLAAYGRLREGAAATCSESVAQVDEATAKADIAYLAEEIPKALAQGLEGVDRIATIVRALKEFSHPDGGAMQDVDLARSIASTLTIARNEYKYVAELQTDFAEDMPLVRCVQGEINQVVLNLVINAAHAIGDVVKNSGDKGLIRVTLCKEDEYAVITIADTGGGIPDRIRDKIFDPFFTTKGVGKGTGQGLYIARDIVTKKHGGSLHFETKAGVGSTFIIRLPIRHHEASHE